MSLKPPIQGYWIDTTGRMRQDQIHTLPNGEKVIHKDNEKKFRTMCELAHLRPLRLEAKKENRNE